MPEDADLRAVLRIFGDLNSNLNYAGSSRAGYVADEAPGAGNEKGQHLPPLALDEIVTGPRSRAVVLALCFAELWSQSPTMLQPVGGMDAIVRAFAKALGGMIQLDQEVVRDRPRRRSGAGRFRSITRPGNGAPSTRTS